MPWPANQILQSLLDRAEPASAQEIAARTNLSIDQVWKSADTLVENKLLTRADRGKYLITDAGRSAIAEGNGCMPGPKGPTGPVCRRRNTIRQRLWLALRIERKGTIQGIVSLILQDGEDAALLTTNAQKYFSALCRANYLTRLPGRSEGTAPTSNGYVRYLLVENTGPKAPMVRRLELALYDPNTGKSVPFTREAS
ncbi:hypothetical protein L4X63_09450 [Geomonas sp. Red32]|uniref:hypothetical protein n=1 Tax=Geomonas sp. Red32 TaxID=2912856 RepID=UPI00202CF2D6|nr:hypothetical protein [Geomonas sp. Red32]MCM0081813.1 hypothetical protein [Geomonas sp. Red32]